MSAPATMPFPLRKGRVHEAYGPGATGFAAVACAQAQGALMWIREAWRAEALHPVGLSAFFDPSRLLVAQARDQTDALAVAEEALKDGAVALVVIEISRPLNLREGRRLQLAAKEGGATGLCLIAEGMGSNAAETRWHCAPVFGSGDSPLSTRMRWEIKKNKEGTLGTWHVRWNPEAHRLDVVSPASQRPGSEGMPD